MALIWLESKEGIKIWFDKLFEPSKRDNRYSYGFKEDPMYKAWLVCMNIFDLFGTEIMTGDSIPDSAFDVKENDRFAPHHLDRKNKASLLLYDMTLTWSGNHPDPFESFSKLSGVPTQHILKSRLRELIEVGIYKKDTLVKDFQWITEDDFRKAFPEDLIFCVSIGKKEYSGSLFYLWNDVFKRDSFENKLKSLNDKITTFREALKNNRNPYFEFLEKHYPKAKDRFLESAIKFSNLFERFGIDKFSQTLHSADELAYIWHIYLMRQSFKL